MADVKSPTVASVSAAMRQAQYLEAVTDGDRIIACGWHTWWAAPGEVRVARVNMFAGPGETFQEMTDTALERYTNVLQDAGWRVVKNARGGFVTVIALEGGGT